MTVIVGTDNGLIVRRDDSGADSLVYSSPTTTREIYSLVTSPVSDSRIWSYQRIPSSSNVRSVYTADGGVTWTDFVRTYPGTGGPLGVFPARSNPWMTPLDSSGNVLGIYTATGPPSNIYTSTDNGLTWSGSSFSYVSPNSTAWDWYTNGKYWWMQDLTTFPNRYVIHGVALDGSGLTTSTGLNANTFELFGRYGVPTLWTYSSPGASGGAYTFDVSSGTAVQTSTWTEPTPTQGWILPLDSTSALFMDVAGHLYRSSNLGGSWTNVLPGSPVSIPNSFYLPMAATNGTDIWVISAFPNLLHSPDFGFTWETVTISSTLSGATRWTSISTAPPSGPPVPGFSKVLGSSLTQTFFVPT